MVRQAANPADERDRRGLSAGARQSAAETAVRIEFPRKVRATIIARAAGHCEACGAVLKPGEGEVDHVLPAALGGTAEAANGRLICKVCHKAKTATDIGMIRKADRQRDRASGALKSKAKFPLRVKL